LTAARRLAAVPEPRKPRRQRARILTPHESDVEAAIAAIDPDHVQCRDTGHTWTRHNARWIDADNCWEQTLKCRQCSTERVRYLSRYGSILAGRYEYAPGYTIKGIGRLSSSDRDGIRLRGVTGE
jgi:hypothetical protein